MIRRPRRRGSNGRYTSATPGVVPGKRSVSVSAAMFRRAKDFALDNDVAMAWIVEEAVAPVLAESKMVRVESVPQARRPARKRPAPPPERPIPFWLLPTGPVRRDK